MVIPLMGHEFSRGIVDYPGFFIKTPPNQNLEASQYTLMSTPPLGKVKVELTLTRP